MGTKSKKDSKMWRPPLEFIELPLDKRKNTVSNIGVTSRPVEVTRVPLSQQHTGWVTKQFPDTVCGNVKRKARSKSKTSENTATRRKKSKHRSNLDRSTDSANKMKYVPLSIERRIHVPVKLRLEWSSSLSCSPNGWDRREGRSNQASEATDSDSGFRAGSDVVLVPDTPESEYGLTIKMRQLLLVKRRLF